MRPARVCMVVQNYYQIDPRVRRKADTLVEHGYTVDVIALREAKRERVFRAGGVTVYTVPMPKMRGGQLRYLYEYATFWMLAFALLTFLFVRHRYQVVDVNTLPDALVFAALVPKMMGARVVLDMHEVMPEFYMSKFGVDRRHPLVRLVTLLEKWSVRFADRVVASNDLIARQLIERGLAPSKLTVVMNSADENLFAVGRHVAQEVEPDDARPIALMYHGTLTPTYGLDIAIQAVAKVRTLRPNLALEFRILGRGPAQDDLVRQAERLGLDGQVRFLGAVPLDDVASYVARCDLGLLPTRQDAFLDLSFSNKLVEYVVMSKPVIASRLRGYRRYFREESLAFFDAENVDSLAEAIVHVVEHPGLWAELARNALRDYRSIDWQVMGRRYLDVIEGCV